MAAQIAIKTRLLICLPFLSTGAGLLTFFVAKVALWMGVFAAGTVALGALIPAWRMLQPYKRLEVKRRIRQGWLVALLATAAYDVSRFSVVKITGSSVRPFEAIERFGQLLLVTDSPTTATRIAGVTYHIANGVGFGLAYLVMVARPRWITGVVWALLLELVMVTFYPGWLQLKAADEFLGVTVFGHIAYGSVLGLAGARFSIRNRPRTNDTHLVVS
jgi:hypothetical protein